MPIGQEGAVWSKEHQFVQRTLIGPQGASLSGGRRSAKRAITKKIWIGCATVDVSLIVNQENIFKIINPFVRKIQMRKLPRRTGTLPRGSRVAGAADPAAPVAPTPIIVHP